MSNDKRIVHNNLDLKIDKQSGPVAFNEEFHKYWNVKHPDRKYTSVTTIIGMYHPEFDSEFWLNYKTLQKLATPKEFDSVKSRLLNTNRWDDSLISNFLIDPDHFQKEKDLLEADWAANNKEACDRGTAYHNMREAEFYEREYQDVKRYVPIEGTFHCQKGNFDLDRENAVMPEFLVYFTDKTGELNIAGQVDLIIKEGNDIVICDFKTNKKGITTKAFFDRAKKSTQKMFYPLNHLEDTMLNHYTLQMSIYAWMLQRIRPEFNIKLLKLIHSDLEGKETEFEVPYLKKEVTNLFKHYRDKLILEKDKKEIIKFL